MFVKIVRKFIDSSGSYLTSISDSEYRYRIGLYTNRKINDGALAVFSSLDYARHFMEVNNYNPAIYRIYWCEIIPSSETCLYRNCGNIVPASLLPKGTIFADSVKLWGEVQPIGRMIIR